MRALETSSGRPARLAPPASPCEHEHFVQFYEQDAYLVESIAEFIGDALRDGAACILIATTAHRHAVEQRCRAQGLDIAGARRRGQYVPLDAGETLAAIMREGAPDEVRFIALVGGVIADAKRRYPTVRAMGEMVALLCEQGDRAAAAQLEALWNALQRRHAFTLFCAYPLASFAGDDHDRPFAEVCNAHTRVIPTERYAALGTADERLRAVLELQRKAHAFDSAASQRAAHENALRRAAAELADAARRADEFLVLLGHELRNPLSPIVTALHRMRGAGDAPHERQVIERQVARMTQLVDDLVGVPRMERAGATLDVARSGEPPLRAGAHRCLVVDDNVDAAEGLAEVLREFGHDVHVAYDGAGAIGAAANLQPHVVILDICMPEIDGHEVARRLRNDVALRSALLIALSGHGRDRDAELARAAGFDHHLVKPVDIARLEMLLRSHNASVPGAPRGAA